MPMQRSYASLSKSDEEALRAFASPLIDSSAFQRLEHITFLGILSPRFAEKVNSPVLQRYARLGIRKLSDGTRAAHSLGVASLALEVCHNLALPFEVEKYAIAWGLLHDIAAWPLSHTGEAAFARLTRVSGQELRKRMIEGHESLGKHLLVDKPLLKMGVEPSTLLKLFCKKRPALDFPLLRLWDVIHSPLTPDTLEGMWRCGRVFGVEVPNPRILLQALDTDVLDATVISPKRSQDILTFWRRKSDIYEKHINSSTMVAWESAWSNAIFKWYQGIDLTASLELDEDRIVDDVAKEVQIQRGKVMRYKPPLKYSVVPVKKRKLDHDSSIEELREILTKHKGKASGI